MATSDLTRYCEKPRPCLLVALLHPHPQPVQAAVNYDRRMVTRSKPAAITRRTLIAAAAELLDQSGPDAVTLRAVGARAGVSRGAPYGHFEDKAHLLTVLATDSCRSGYTPGNSRRGFRGCRKCGGKRHARTSADPGLLRKTICRTSELTCARLLPTLPSTPSDAAGGASPFALFVPYPNRPHVSRPTSATGRCFVRWAGRVSGSGWSSLLARGGGGRREESGAGPKNEKRGQKCNVSGAGPKEYATGPRGCAMDPTSVTTSGPYRRRGTPRPPADPPGWVECVPSGRDLTGGVGPIPIVSRFGDHRAQALGYGLRVLPERRHSISDSGPRYGLR